MLIYSYIGVIVDGMYKIAAERLLVAVVTYAISCSIVLEA